LADERAREVLLASASTPRSAQELAEACDGSLSSIYRRVSVLAEYGLLDEETRVDLDGNHYSVYHPGFERLNVELHSGEIRAELREKNASRTIDVVGDDGTDSE
jgi:DNA-binding transcriptional ArsR family regulator